MSEHLCIQSLLILCLGENLFHGETTVVGDSYGRRCSQCRYCYVVVSPLWNNGAIMRQLLEKIKGLNVKYEKVKGGIKKRTAENTEKVCG